MITFALFCVYLLIVLCALAVPLVIGVLVYCNANKRVDCDPWFWALVAALVPYFIGLIVYVAVCSDYPLKEPVIIYDELGNPIGKKTVGFPKWAKILLIVLAVLFTVLLLGGCVSVMYSIFSFNSADMDSFYYF